MVIRVLTIGIGKRCPSAGIIYILTDKEVKYDLDVNLEIEQKNALK
jgi:hypothetical protein